MNKKDFVLFSALLFLPIITFSYNRFPAGDFWWYHTKNWIILNHLFPDFIGWNPYWYGGYPLLQMVSPGAHVIAVLLSKLTGLNVFYSGILLNSFSYVFLVFSFLIFLKKYNVEENVAYLSAFLLAFSPRLISEVFGNGHYPYNLAFATGFLAWAFIDSRMKFTILMFLTFLFHFQIFNHFAIIFISYYLIYKNKTKLRAVIFSVIAVLFLGSFWLIPAISESRDYIGTIGILHMFNPFVAYALSFGPFILLVLFSFIKLKINEFIRIGIILTFLLTLTVYFPFLYFLSPVVTTGKTVPFFTYIAIYLIAAGILNFLKGKRLLRYFGFTLLIMWIIFSLFSINIYLNQDTISVLKTDHGKIVRDDFNSAFLLKKDFDTLTMARTNFDPVLSPLILNSFSLGGLGAPSPARIQWLHEGEYYDYLKYMGAIMISTDENISSDSFELIPTERVSKKEYFLDLKFFFNLVRDNEFLYYLIFPENYPAEKVEKTIYTYRIKQPEKVVEVAKHYPVTISEKIFAQCVDKIYEFRVYSDYPIITSSREIGEYIRNIDSCSELSSSKAISEKINIHYTVEKNRILINTAKPHSLTPVIIKITYSQHWKAYIEKRQIPIYKIAPQIMLIMLPSDVNEVEIQYGRNIYDYIGYGLSLIGLIIVGLFLIEKGSKREGTDTKTGEPEIEHEKTIK